MAAIISNGHEPVIGKKNKFTITLITSDDRSVIIRGEELYGNVSYGQPVGEPDGHTVSAVIDFGYGFTARMSGDGWRQLENDDSLSDVISLCVLSPEHAVEAITIAEKGEFAYRRIATIDETRSGEVFFTSGNIDTARDQLMYINTRGFELDDNTHEVYFGDEDDVERIPVHEAISRLRAVVERFSRDAIISSRLEDAGKLLGENNKAANLISEIRELISGVPVSRPKP